MTDRNQTNIKYTGRPSLRTRVGLYAWAAGAAMLGGLMLPCAAFALSIPPAESVAAAGDTNVPAKQWAIACARNEIQAIQYSGSYLRYRVHLVNSKGDQTRDVIESRDGTVARLIARDNRPLSTEEDAAEHQRLNDMLGSPAAFARHIRGDVSGKKNAVDLLQVVSDAMIFSYAAGQPQRGGDVGRRGGEAEIVLDFKPDPRWVPPSMMAEALTGLEGRLWIDSRTQHLMAMEATIFQSVNFGYGVFAHIYPGGKLALEQVHVGDQRWIFSHFVQHVTFRAMMVKTIREDAEVRGSDFAAVPAMKYQDAIKLLLATPLPR